MIDVAIFGLGRVGAGFGLSPRSNQYKDLTHLGVISSLEDTFNVVHLADKSMEKVRLAWERLGMAPPLGREMPAKVDICVISSDTAAHFESCLEALELNPGLILLEKPATDSSRQLRELIKLCGSRGTALWIAYNRRWDEEVEKNLMILRKNEARVLNVRAMTSGDLESNVSHVLEMSLRLAPALCLERIENLAEWGKRLTLTDKKSDIALEIVHVANYTSRLFEIEVVTESGILNLFASGFKIMLRPSDEGSWLEGQNLLRPDGLTQGGIRNSFRNMYKRLAESVASDEISDNLGEALAARKLLDEIRNQGTR